MLAALQKRKDELVKELHAVEAAMKAFVQALGTEAEADAVKVKSAVIAGAASVARSERKMSAATRKKLSASKKAYWAAKRKLAAKVK